MVAEMVPEKELQPRAFSIMPFVWSLGSVVGPAFGGFFSNPAENYPDFFGKMEYFKRFPFALPNLLATVFFLISATSATLFLKETLSTKRDKKDWGLLVGERLTRAFSRRRHRRPSRGRRTSSFVDGEATAPLVPVRAMPRNGGKDAQAPPKMADVFTSQTVINLLAYALLAFHSVAYDQNIAVFMDYEVIERTPENYKLPFKFTGGFGMSEGQIGTIFTIYGITCGVIQFLFYPALVARFGVLRCFRACCTSYTTSLSPFLKNSQDIEIYMLTRIARSHSSRGILLNTLYIPLRHRKRSLHSPRSRHDSQGIRHHRRVSLNHNPPHKLVYFPPRPRHSQRLRNHL